MSSSLTSIVRSCINMRSNEHYIMAAHCSSSSSSSSRAPVASRERSFSDINHIKDITNVSYRTASHYGYMAGNAPTFKTTAEALESYKFNAYYLDVERYISASAGTVLSSTLFPFNVDFRAIARAGGARGKKAAKGVVNNAKQLASSTTVNTCSTVKGLASTVGKAVKSKVGGCFKAVKSLKPKRTNNLPAAPAPMAPAPMGADITPLSHPLEWAVTSHSITITEVESHLLQWSVSSHPITITEVESHPLEWAVSSHPIKVMELESHPLVMEEGECWEEQEVEV